MEAPLREMLEECLKGTKRTRRVASRRMIAAQEWTDERSAAWEAVRARIAHAGPMYHLKKGYRVLMFTDASDSFWGDCVTQVPEEGLWSEMPVAEMSHEPLGFVSGAFKNAQVRWPVIDKEAFAIISTCRRLQFLFWGGFCVYCDHRKLAYIFHPGATNMPPSKIAEQRLQG